MAIATLPSIHALALRVESKSVAFKDILPFLDVARMVDVFCNPFYLSTHTHLPEIALAVGDHEIRYHKSVFSHYATITVLIRSDLKPSKVPGCGGLYQKVLKSECKLPSKRDEKRLLAAVQAKCTGDPWYHTSGLGSWKFTNSVPMESTP